MLSQSDNTETWRNLYGIRRLHLQKALVAFSSIEMRIVLFRLLVLLVAVIPLAQASHCPSVFWNQRTVQKRCPISDKCIRESTICDGVFNCRDGSDEFYCTATLEICSQQEFRCSDGTCVFRSSFCDGKQDCLDNSDEIFCYLDLDTFCPSTWYKCDDLKRCIPPEFQCDDEMDCNDGSEEQECKFETTSDPSPTPPPIPNTANAKSRGVRWLLNKRKNSSSIDRWGHNVHRIASAIYLGNESEFLPGMKTGEEINYELNIQLLQKLSGNHTLRNQELALYIQALTVTCSNPRDFFGHNLVSELRKRVESSNHTNPFEILTLCNARDNMTNKDIERVTKSFDSPHRPFWTDIQAIAAMALQCLSSSSNVKVDERMVKDMQEELKKRQFRNGTVDNPITTALVLQALFYNESYKEFFNFSGALSVLLASQDRAGSWGSVQNTYYALPALSFKSLLNISSKHCVNGRESEDEALNRLQGAKGKKFVVQYSIWVGDDVDLGRTWRVRLESAKNHTFYDVIETVRRLDSRHNVTYNVMDYKPYVSSLYGKQDDPELDMYWFTYVRSLLLQEAPRRIEASPVDVQVEPNQELILWYKPGKWDGTPQDEGTA